MADTNGQASSMPDAPDTRGMEGRDRILKFLGYMFARHDPSEKTPPMPAELAEWATDTLLASAVGMVLGGGLQWREEAAAGPVQPPPGAPTKAHAAKAMAEEQTQRLVRVFNASLRSSLRFGGLAAVFYGVQMGGGIYRARHDFYNAVMGGMAAGSVLGSSLAAGRGSGRVRGAVLGAALGASIGVPAGMLQDYLVTLLPPEQQAERQARLQQTEIIIAGEMPRERPERPQNYDPAGSVIQQLEASLAGSPTQMQRETEKSTGVGEEQRQRPRSCGCLGRGGPSEPGGATDRISASCSPKKVFTEHSHEVLDYLHRFGVELLAEFEVEDEEVFAAFGDEPIITFGSDTRRLDAETEWRQRLAANANQAVPSHPLTPQNLSHASSPRPAAPVGVQAYVVTIKDAAAPGGEGLLHPLIRLEQARRCSFAVFTLPAVQAVVKFKWAAFARRLLLVELALYCVWLGAFYLFCTAVHGENLAESLTELLASTRGRLTVAAEVVALLAMAPFLALEAGTLAAYGRGWFRDPTNILDMATYTLQIGISVAHLGRWWMASRWLTYAMAVQAVLLMFRMQYYTQALRPTRFSFATVVREVVADSGWVFALLLLTAVAYAAAFHIQFRCDETSEKGPPEEFSSFPRSVLTSIEHLYGDLELKPFLNSGDPVFGTILALSYIFIMGYALINLLLGMIVRSVDRVMNHEGAKQIWNQARVVDELEALLPAWYERRRTAWHPAYVHVLRINPKKMNVIEADKLWSRRGGAAMAAVLGNGNGGGEEEEEGGGKGGGEKEMEEKLQKIEKHLEWQRGALAELLQRVGAGSESYMSANSV